jgi:large subunit ribosomal protein L24
MLSASEAARQQPLAAAKTLAEDIAGNLRMPFPALLNITIDSLNLGGAALQRLAAELETDGEDLNIRMLDFRAPGVTQVHVSGKLATAASGLAFKGSSSIESNDPRALVAWLSDRGDAQPIAPSQMRLAGDVSFSQEAVMVEHFNLDLDRMNVAGRFAYMWEGHDRPARVDAALTTPDIDIDRVYALAQAIAGDTKFAWPAQGALSLTIGHASVFGVEARAAEVNLRLDANGLAIDPLMVADFGGAALAVRGRIDTKSLSPRGAITLDLDARTLDGILTLVEKLAPDAAEQLRSSAGRVTPILLRASLIMDPGSTSNVLANAKFKADGRAGMFRLAVLGDANTASEAFKADKLAAAGSARINLIGRIDADDCQALMELARLDRFLAVDKRPAQLTLSAKGSLDGDLEVDSRLVSGAVELSTNGKVRISPQANRRAELDFKATNVKVRSPRPVAGARAPELLPASLTARLAMAGDALSLTDVKGSVAGAPVAGRLNLGMQQPMTIDGAIDLGAINLGGALATIVGAPLGGEAAKENVVWPSEPFEQMLGPLNGRLLVKAARVTLTPKLEVRDFAGIAHFGDSQFALQTTEGRVAGGRLSGELILLRQREGLVARTRFGLSGANAAELLPGDGAISGRLTFDATAEGTGMSPVALIGALEGSGTFTLENGRLARLDPKTFDAIMRAVDQGLPIDTNRLRDRTDSALSGGALVLPRAEGAITIAAGQARLSNAMAGDRGNELALNARVNLAESELDARLVLTAAATSATSLPPEITVTLKGPLRAPNRSVDVAAFAGWLALRAVEQQSKKLDVLEGRQPSAPLPGAAEERPPNRPAINPGQIDGSAAAAAPPVAGPVAPRPSPQIRNVQKPKPPEPARPAPMESMPRQLLFGVQ